MLIEEMPSLAFNEFLEGEDPLVETPLAYEISILQFVSLGDISLL